MKKDGVSKSEKANSIKFPQSSILRSYFLKKEKEWEREKEGGQKTFKLGLNISYAFCKFGVNLQLYYI